MKKKTKENLNNLIGGTIMIILVGLMANSIIFMIRATIVLFRWKPPASFLTLHNVLGLLMLLIVCMITLMNSMKDIGKFVDLVGDKVFSLIPIRPRK